MNERNLENLIQLCFDFNKNQYEMESRSYSYFDFVVTLNDKKYVIEVKNTKPCAEIINRVAYKLQLIEQKQQVDACFIVFPELSQKYEENICKKIILNRCIEIVTPIELFKR